MNLVSTALNDTSVDWIYSFSNDLQVVDLLQNEAKSLIIPTVQFYIGFWEYDSSDKGNKNLHQWNKFLLWLKKSSTMTNVVGILSDVEGVFYYDLCSICSTYFSKKKSVNGSSRLTGKYRKHAIREIPEIIREVGVWSVLKEIQPYAEIDPTKESVEKNHYRVGFIKEDPFIVEYQDDDGSYKLGGYCIDVLEAIAEYLNFTYEYVDYTNEEFGSVNELGRLSGLAGDLQRGVIDFAIGAIKVTFSREEILDFTIPHYDLIGFRMLAKRSHSTDSFFRFLFIIDTSLWICIFGAYFLTSFLIWVFDKFSPYSVTNNKAKYLNDSQHCEFTLKHSFWYCLATMTPQGGGDTPRNLSGRLIAVTWWLFGFIVLASYTANLAAFFTVSHSDFSIKTIEDLGKQTKLKYTIVNNSFSERYFLRMMEIEQRFYSISDNLNPNISMSPLQRIAYAVWDYPMEDFYTQMYRSMSEHLVQTFEEGVELVLRSKSIHDGYIFIANESPLKMVEIRDCRLQIIGEPFNERPLSFAARRYSPIIDKLNIGLLNLVKERKTETLKDKWWNRHPNRTFCQSEVVKSGVISMESIGVLFLFLLAATIISALSLFFEFIYISYKKKH
ncbi:Glutamate receptor ionotropic, kainate 2 [Trichinella sp. T9]|nr:Glutamate receptor ionotropic, kainate 2 [Trichinella sp. T9]